MEHHEQTVLKLYVIEDKKSKRFLPPFFASNDDDAKRIISVQVNHQSGLICSYPEDFNLYFIGTYDQFDGRLDYDPDCMAFICNLKDLQSDESVKYQAVLKEVKTQQGLLDSKLMNINQFMDKIHQQFNDMFSSYQSRFDELYKRNSKSNILNKLLSPSDKPIDK